MKPIYMLKNLKLEDVKTDSPLDKWFYEMIQKDVEQLTVTDVSRMLRQEVYFDIAIPCAWKYVLENPICGEMYAGQMLELLRVGLIKNPNMKEIRLYDKFKVSERNIYDKYEWDNEFEKGEYIKILEEFQQLFD